MQNIRSEKILGAAAPKAPTLAQPLNPISFVLMIDMAHGDGGLFDLLCSG